MARGLLKAVVASETFKREWMFGGFDEASVDREPKKAPLSGEQRLALRLVSDAVEDSFKAPCILRDEARAWLRTELPLMSGRTCIEGLGFDYAAVMVKLERRWSEADA